MTPFDLFVARYDAIMVGIFLFGIVCKGLLKFIVEIVDDYKAQKSRTSI